MRAARSRERERSADYNTVYASLKTRQIDAWVAPSQQASGTVQPGDPAEIIENTFSLDNFVAWAVAKENQPLIDTLNSGLDAIIAPGGPRSQRADRQPLAVGGGGPVLSAVDGAADPPGQLHRRPTAPRPPTRLYEPDRGDILLDGRSVLTDNPDQLRQRIGMVFQHFNLFPHRSVLNNVTLAPRKLKRLVAEARELGLAQLERVRLRHKADVRPGTLSGGQQQRVAIARALAMSPQVMFFDEATSALDPELVKGILALIADLGEDGMTMVVVTHEMGFARSTSDTMVFMDHGQVVESGPPDQIFDAAETDRLRRFLSQVL